MALLHDRCARNWQCRPYEYIVYVHCIQPQSLIAITIIHTSSDLVSQIQSLRHDLINCSVSAISEKINYAITALN